MPLFPASSPWDIITHVTTLKLLHILLEAGFILVYFLVILSIGEREWHGIAKSSPT